MENGRSGVRPPPDFENGGVGAPLAPPASRDTLCRRGDRGLPFDRLRALTSALLTLRLTLSVPELVEGRDGELFDSAQGRERVERLRRTLGEVGAWFGCFHGRR